jgi:hypothetical protein
VIGITRKGLDLGTAESVTFPTESLPVCRLDEPD